MFNRKILILVLFIFYLNHSNAQLVGIGTTSPDTTSILDLANTTRGFLTPRMTQAQRNAISSPETGLLIYQTDNTQGFYYNSGTPASPVWTLMTVPSFWGDPPRIGFWNPSGTLIISNTELSWDTNYSRLGVGTIAPSSKLHIIGTSDNVLVKVAANATQTVDIMKISDGNTGAFFFTFDNAGRMIVRGQGTTTSANVFHLTAYNGNPTVSMTTSFFEIDCDATTGNELVERLSQSNATNTPDLWLNMSHGTVSAPTNLATNDFNSFFFTSGYYNGGWGYLTNIISYYLGSGTTQISDITFHTLTAGPTTYTGERMRITPTGEVGINATTFTGGNLEKLMVNSAGSTNNTVGYGDINNTLKLNIQNLNSGTTASSDIVATNDAGTETMNYIDLGINSSGNTDAAYSITAANDGYLYNIGNDLVIGLGPSSVGKSIKFFTGGTLSSNEDMRITSSGKIGIGTTAPDASALVDISSTTEGFLPPRMTASDRGSIGSPANGLLVYQTNGTSGFYYAQGGGWSAISSSSTAYWAGYGLNLSGATFSINTPVIVSDGGTGTTTFNSGGLIIAVGTTTPLTTNSNLSWDNTNSRLGIGTSAPAVTLDVEGTAQIGLNGTAINHIIKATVNHNVPNIASKASSTETFTVTNAVTSSMVIVSPATALTDGLIIAYARVSAANTVEVTFLNDSGGAIDPPAMDFYISLIH